MAKEDTLQGLATRLTCTNVVMWELIMRLTIGLFIKQNLLFSCWSSMVELDVKGGVVQTNIVEAARAALWTVCMVLMPLPSCDTRSKTLNVPYFTQST